MTSSTFATRLLLSLAVAAVMSAVPACSDDDEKSDPTAACDSMCKSTGFASSRVDAQPHETNCFCTGTGTVTPAACTDMCSKAAGKPGAPFTSGAGVTNANACQCQ